MADFELVLLDDGSHCAETIAELNRLAGHDCRVRVFHEPHRGLTPSLNVGLSHCRADIICRQDSDDWSAPDRLERQVAFLRWNPGMAVVGSWTMLHQQDQTPLWVNRLPTDPESIRSAFQHMNPFCHGAVCFRREAAAAIGGYREEFTCSQDYDFLWRLCDRFAGANLPAPLYHHRYTTRSISTKRAHEQARNRSLARRVAAMRAQRLAEDFALARQEIDADFDGNDASALLKQGDHLLLSGHYLAALRINLAALMRAPFHHLPYLKTLRLALYVFAPALRPRLFGHAGRRN
jgi:glycosyltransferase involved in cell wall biosynthesis